MPNLKLCFHLVTYFSFLLNNRCEMQMRLHSKLVRNCESQAQDKLEMHGKGIVANHNFTINFSYVLSPSLMISYGIGVIVSALTSFNKKPFLGSLIFRLVTGAGSAQKLCFCSG